MYACRTSIDVVCMIFLRTVLAWLVFQFHKCDAVSALWHPLDPGSKRAPVPATARHSNDAALAL